MNSYHGNRAICANCAHKDEHNVCRCRLSKTYKEVVFIGESCRWWKQKTSNMLNTDELYQKILKVTNSDERGHWCSDLYCKVKPETTRILKRYQFNNQVSTFYDRLTGKLWYSIPFAYNPYWEVKTHAEV